MGRRTGTETVAKPGIGGPSTASSLSLPPWQTLLANSRRTMTFSRQRRISSRSSSTAHSICTRGRPRRMRPQRARSAKNSVSRSSAVAEDRAGGSCSTSPRFTWARTFLFPTSADGVVNECLTSSTLRISRWLPTWCARRFPPRRPRSTGRTSSISTPSTGCRMRGWSTPSSARSKFCASKGDTGRSCGHTRMTRACAPSRSTLSSWSSAFFGRMWSWGPASERGWGSGRRPPYRGSNRRRRRLDERARRKLPSSLSSVRAQDGGAGGIACRSS